MRRTGGNRPPGFTESPNPASEQAIPISSGGYRRGPRSSCANCQGAQTVTSMPRHERGPGSVTNGQQSRSVRRDRRPEIEPGLRVEGIGRNLRLHGGDPIPSSRTGNGGQFVEHQVLPEQPPVHRAPMRPAPQMANQTGVQTIDPWPAGQLPPPAAVEGRQADRQLAIPQHHTCPSAYPHMPALLGAVQGFAVTRAHSPGSEPDAALGHRHGPKHERSAPPGTIPWDANDDGGAVGPAAPPPPYREHPGKQ